MLGIRLSEKKNQHLNKNTNNSYEIKVADCWPCHKITDGPAKYWNGDQETQHETMADHLQVGPTISKGIR